MPTSWVLGSSIRPRQLSCDWLIWATSAFCCCDLARELGLLGLGVAQLVAGDRDGARWARRGVQHQRDREEGGGWRRRWPVRAFGECCADRWLNERATSSLAEARGRPGSTTGTRTTGASAGPGTAPEGTTETTEPAFRARIPAVRKVTNRHDRAGRFSRYGGASTWAMCIAGRADSGAWSAPGRAGPKRPPRPAVRRFMAEPAFAWPVPARSTTAARTSDRHLTGPKGRADPIAVESRRSGADPRHRGADPDHWPGRGALRRRHETRAWRRTLGRARRPWEDPRRPGAGTSTGPGTRA